MSRKDTIDLVHRYYASINKPDLDEYFSMFTPEIEFRMSGNTPFSGTFRGIEEVRKLLSAVFERFVPEQIDFGNVYRILCADDDGAAVVMAGKGKTTLGREYKQTYLHVFKIRDGKIYRFYDFYDTVMIESAIFGNDLKAPEKEVEAPLDFLDEPLI